jgi:DNA polymerase
MEPSKQEQYSALVAKRKDCRDCAGLGLHNPAESDLREFDSDDEIGPWTRLDGDLDARLMVVGQDWGDVGYYTQNEGLDEDGNPRNNATNGNLEQLLKVAGFAAPLSFGGTPRGLFLTNAILCLKEGGMQARVKAEWFTNCQRFLREQIEIVSPCVVVGMGHRAYKAVLRAFGLRVPSGPLLRAVEDEHGSTLPNGSTLLAVYHCGQRVINTRLRSLEAQVRDWERVANALSRPRHPPHSERERAIRARDEQP